MQHFDCLDKNIYLGKKLFLEASAGTGKTFALEHIVIKLLLQGKTIDQILIVTFTKAATRDIKQKIQKSLNETLLQLSSLSDEKCFPYIEAIKQKEPHEIHKAIDTIDQALSSIEHACITTIHSFAHKTLHLHHLIDNTKVVDPSQDNFQIFLPFIKNVLRDLPHSLLSFSSINALLNLYKKDLSLLAQKICTLLQDQSKLNLPSHTESLLILQKFVDKYLPVKDQILDDYTLLAPCYKGLTNRNKEQITHYKHQLDALFSKDFEELLLLKPTLFSKLKRNNLKKASINNLPTIKHESFFDECETLIYPIISMLTDPKIALLRIKELVQEKIASHYISPNDLLTILEENSHSKILQDNLLNQYKAVLIDEFQDTDPIQWNIFNHLFLHQDNPVDFFTVVGDPKQSIYKFRGASLDSYLKARSLFNSNEVKTLSNNFRSHKNLIKDLNQFFHPSNAPGWLSFKENDKSLNYQQVKAQKSFKSRLSSNLTVVLSKKDKEEETFQFIANEIIFLNKKHEVPFCDIAILVKDRFQQQRLSSYLQSKNLPIAETKASLITNDKAFFFIKALFACINSPYNQNALNTLLFLLFQKDFVVKEKTKWSDFFLVKKESSLSVILTKLLHTPLPDESSTLAELYFTHFGSSSYHCLQQIIDLLLDKNILLNNAHNFLTSIESLSVDVAPYIAIKPTNSRKTINIMTTHKSKGLEFSIVFALGISTRDYKEKNNTLLSDHNDQEKARLLYVALTRASLKAYAFYFENKKLEEKQASPIEIHLARLKNPFLPYQSLYGAIKELTVEHVTEKLKNLEINTLLLEDNLKSLTLNTSEDASDIFLSPVDQKISYDDHIKMLSFSSLYPKASFSTTLTEKETLPPGKETGTLLHSILEHLLKKGLHHPLNTKAIMEIISFTLLATHLESWQEEVFTLIINLLHLEILPSFSLIDLNKTDLVTEEEIFMTYEESYLSGYIDLIFKHQKKIYILDWKFNLLSDYKPSTIKKAVRENHYDKQAKIYTLALEKYYANIDSRDFNEIFGGVIIIFARGAKNQEGVYYDQ